MAARGGAPRGPEHPLRRKQLDAAVAAGGEAHLHVVLPHRRHHPSCSTMLCKSSPEHSYESEVKQTNIDTSSLKP